MLAKIEDGKARISYGKCKRLEFLLWDEFSTLWIRFYESFNLIGCHVEKFLHKKVEKFLLKKVKIPFWLLRQTVSS